MFALLLLERGEIIHMPDRRTIFAGTNNINYAPAIKHYQSR